MKVVKLDCETTRYFGELMVAKKDIEMRQNQAFTDMQALTSRMAEFLVDLSQKYGATNGRIDDSGEYFVFYPND